jgi:hypothetical protein
MEAQDFVSEVSGDLVVCTNCVLTYNIYIEDYAVTEASLAIIRILQEFPAIRIPPAEPNGPVGSERQNLTIVLSSGEGARVLLK